VLAGGDDPPEPAGVPDATDELAHDAEPAAGGDRARLRGEITGGQAHQRCLAGAVRPDQRGRDAIANPEGNVVEQCPAVRQGVAEVRYLDMTHDLPRFPDALAWPTIAG